MSLAENYLRLPRASDIRGARAALDWTQMELAYKCGVNIATVTSIEKEKSKPSKELLEKMANVFAEEDIYFLPSGGYKVEQDVAKFYEGVDAYQKVLVDALKTCASDKKEVLLLGDDDRRSSDKVNATYEDMYNAGIHFKYLIAKENNYCLGPIEEYRQIDKDLFLSNDVILIYDDKVMFFAELEGDLESYKLTKVKTIILRNKELANKFRAHFYRLWDKGRKVEKSSAEQIFFRNGNE